MWAQSWGNLYERIKPFDGSDLDITSALKRHNYTALKIFQKADSFYQSLGLPSNEMSYTGDSIIEKPKDRLIVCHASAWVCIFFITFPITISIRIHFLLTLKKYLLIHRISVLEKIFALSNVQL